MRIITAIRLLFLPCVLLLTLHTRRANAATKQEIKAYPDFAELLEKYNYDWEPHEVKTEDGWYLTLIRVKTTGKAEPDPSKLPILLLHGSMDSGLGFLTRSTTDDSAWALQMVRKGYEVWINNSRGVKYSYRHERDDEWSLKEKWNFNWADMGYYDVPAAIEKVLETSKAPKLTVIGHSQGTAQMFYALSHKQDFFAERVHRFISLASCIMPEPYP